METKIPQTKQEAFDWLDALLSEEDKKELVTGDDAFKFHFSFGLWIRNNWIYQQDEEVVARLAKAFGTFYIGHDADNLSGTIIDSYQRYLKRKRAIGQK